MCVFAWVLKWRRQPEWLHRRVRRGGRSSHRGLRWFTLVGGGSGGGGGGGGVAVGGGFTLPNGVQAGGGHLQPSLAWWGEGGVGVWGGGMLYLGFCTMQWTNVPNTNNSNQAPRQWRLLRNWRKTTEMSCSGISRLRRGRSSSCCPSSWTIGSSCLGYFAGSVRQSA